MGFFYNPNTELNFFVMLVKGELTMDNYAFVMGRSLTVLRFGNTWWATLITVVVLALAMSLMVVKIDRHMRMGVMPGIPMRRAFGFFPIMLAFVVCWIAVAEVAALVILGIAYLASFVGNATAITSICLALAFGMRVFLTYAFLLLIIAFPLKYSENYRFNRAMSYSARIMFSKTRLLIGLAFAYSFARIALMALAYLLAPYKLDVLVYSLGLLFALTYVPCLAYKHYYDDIGGERRDLSRYLFG